MSNNRKVQGDIDKLLKKVQQGMEVYEDVFEKTISAPNQQIKEKHEGDLKKEIKKLQRLRDDIKGMCASNEVKDKKALEQARKNIEAKMESFKGVERETKTKAYSKDGLAAAPRTDPESQARYHTEQWLKGAISDMGEQNERLEFEIEAELQGAGSKKKRGAGNESPKEERLAANKFHILKLEQLLRMLDNEELTPEDIDVIEDDIQQYVDDEEDTGEAVASIYDEFDLPEVQLSTLGGDDDSDEESKKPKKEEKKETPPVKAVPAKAAAAKKNTPLSDGKKQQPAVKEPVKAPAAPAPKPANKTPISGASPKVPMSPTRDFASVVAQNTNREGSNMSSQQHSSLSQMNSPSQPLGGGPDGLDDDGDMDAFGDEAMANVHGGGTLAELGAHGQLEKPNQPSVWDQGRPTLLNKVTSPMKQPPQGQSSTAATQQATPQTQATSAPPQQQATSTAPAQVSTSSRSSSSSTSQMIASVLKQLDCSLKHLPHPTDCERRKAYIPPNPHATPAYYPQQILQAFNAPEMFSKFDPETLFFIFYYQQGTYQQYLAAKELKRQSWRYHKKFNTWFQRHDTPKNCTDESEQGAYIYFDFESGWCQRIKNDFVFKYTYLEDELV